ncbi:FAD-dependent oxidoreductase, partial [Vibrio fluvialis]|nr:FAD-dependent oxidoreductase [Vibrio fluvialis]
TDIVISAAGLCANTQLAKEAAIRVNKGIVVDSCLQTSIRNVFALGDCAEIQERMIPYLQPIVLSANVLGKQLLGQDAELVLPPMMVKVKTPSYPIQLAGTVNGVENWEVSISAPGIVAKAKDDNGHLVGFVVTSEQVTQAFPLLRELSKSSGR